MAKKKSKKQISSIVSLISAALGIVALVMIFLPAIGVKDTETTYTGLQIVFGYKEKPFMSEVTVFEFSFMNLLTYLLVIAGVVFTVLGLLGKGSKFATFIAAICFLVGGIFFFFQLQFCIPNTTVSNVTSLFGGNIKEIGSLGAGSIIGGICSILAAIALGYNIACARK